jgi:hypothetical protein
VAFSWAPDDDFSGGGDGVVENNFSQIEDAAVRELT